MTVLKFSGNPAPAEIKSVPAQVFILPVVRIEHDFENVMVLASEFVEVTIGVMAAAALMPMALLMSPRDTTKIILE